MFPYCDMRGHISPTVRLTIFCCLLWGCGRTGLSDGNPGSEPSTASGSSPSTTSTGSSTSPNDPCQLGSLPIKIADVPAKTEVKRISVADGVVTFTGRHYEVDTSQEFIDLYQVPACGGSITQIAGEPGSDIPAFVEGNNGLYFGLVPRMANNPKIYLHSKDGNILIANTPVEPDGLLFEGGELYSYLGSTETVRRIHSDGNTDYLGSGSTFGISTNCVLSQGAFRFVVASDTPAPILSIPEAGGTLELGPTIQGPRQIRAVDGGLIAAYTFLANQIGLGADYGNIERIDLASGASTVLASGQFNPTGLTLRQGMVLWISDGVVRSVSLEGGDAVDRYGTSFGSTDPEQTNLTDLLTADDFAFYVATEDAIFRVPLPH